MPRQPGLWQRKGRPGWWTTIKGRQIPLGDDHGRALKALYDLLARDASITPSRGVQTVSWLWEVYRAAEVRKRGGRVPSRGSYANVHRYCGDFAARWPRLRVADVKAHHVATWLDEHPTWGPSTRAHAVSLVRAMARWAWKQELLEAQPMVRVDTPRPKRRDKIPTHDEVQRLIAELPEGDIRELVRCLYLTGCRPTELRELTFDRVHGDRWEVIDKIRSKTGRTCRVVYPCAEARAIVEAQSAKYAGQGAVFRGQRSGRCIHIAVFNTRVAAARERAGLGKHVAPHALRHLWATDAILSIGMELASPMLGHRSIKTTVDVYGHVRDRVSLMTEAAERVRGK
jgi:integrase